MKPLPWAYTTLDMFLQCPRKYHAIKVVKSYKDEMSEVGLWGDRFHKTAAKFLEGKEDLPDEFAQYRSYLEEIKTVHGTMYVERKLALDAALNPCDFFRGANIFMRAVIDVLHIQRVRALMIDHKTGKRKPDSKQMKAFAIMVFHHHPEVNEVKTMFAWLKTGEKDTETFYRRDLPQLWLEFLPDLQLYKHAFENELWPPRQSGLCRAHCPVLSCEFNGRNR